MFGDPMRVSVRSKRSPLTRPMRMIPRLPTGLEGLGCVDVYAVHNRRMAERRFKYRWGRHSDLFAFC